MNTAVRPGPLRDAIQGALDHLNWHHGHGDVEQWVLITPGETATGVVNRRADRFHTNSSFRFHVTLKDKPRRVMVRALGSTRTEPY